MDNTNKNDKDKLRVITAEEVLEELRRRKKEYGSVFLPTNSYQVIKNGKVVREDNPKINSIPKTNSGQSEKTGTKKNESLRKAVLFLESFAFKKPLQSVFTVLMLLGITTGMYIATRPVGEFENRNQANVTNGTFLGIKATDGTVFPISSRPNIYCKALDLDSNYCGTKYCTTFGAYSGNCLVKNIESTGLSKIVVLSKPDFLNITLDTITGRAYATTTRTLTLADQNKAYSIKILGIPTDQSSYVLLSFTLKLTDTAQPTTSLDMKVRNPVSGGSGGFCEALDEANSKSTWKSYTTHAECLASLHAPVITTSEAVNIDYETQCKNNPANKTVAFKVSATDSDGDLTYFQVANGTANAGRIEKNLEQYIQGVTSELETDSASKANPVPTYSTYAYTNTVKLDLSPTDIGKTIPVRVTAVNQSFTSYNVSKTFQVKVNEKIVGTSPNLSVDITSPAEGSTIKGVTPVLWKVSNSCDFTRYKVEVWDRYCTTYKAKVTDEIFANITQTGTSFNTSWDTRNITDGQYCVRVFVRNALQDPWRVANNGLITVQNIAVNRSPSIISNPPSTNIKVGEIFNYVIKTADSDNDAVSLSMDKKPAWLTLTGSTLTGSTTTTGKYDVSFRAKDSKGAYSVPQMFSITVSPSNNTPSVITFDAFPVSVTGTYAVKWTLTDSDGVKTQVLHISEDGTTWTKLVDLKATDRTYSLDSTKYKNGEYYMKLVVTDNKADVVEKLTDKFVIDNSVAEKGAITITSHEPNTSEQVTSLRPNIVLNLVLPVGTTLDETKLVVTLDDRIITALCSYTNQTITCTLDKDLTLGSHKVVVEYYDNFGVKGSETWEFEVIAEQASSSTTSATVTDTSSDTINIFGRTISKALGILLLVLCIAGILIFIVPLVIFKVWKKKGDDDDGTGGIKPIGPSTNAVYDKPTLSTEEKTPYSYNTKKEFSIPSSNVDNSKVENIPNVKPVNPFLNTPDKRTYTNDEISSFQNTNKYATVPEVTNVVPVEPSVATPVDGNLSKPSTTWGLASKYPSTDNTGGQVGASGSN